VTALEVGILLARDATGAEHFAALDGGVLVVRDDTVTAATPRAVAGEDLEDLEAGVLDFFRRETDDERAANVAFQKLRLAFLKRLFDLETTSAFQ